MSANGYKSSPGGGLHFFCAGFLPPLPTFDYENFQTYRTVEELYSEHPSIHHLDSTIADRLLYLL